MLQIANNLKSKGYKARIRLGDIRYAGVQNSKNTDATYIIADKGQIRILVDLLSDEASIECYNDPPAPRSDRYYATVFFGYDTEGFDPKKLEDLIIEITEKIEMGNMDYKIDLERVWARVRRTHEI
jgi:hypothetical protein